jgi:hypothetical protein
MAPNCYFPQPTLNEAASRAATRVSCEPRCGPLALSLKEARQYFLGDTFSELHGNLVVAYGDDLALPEALMTDLVTLGKHVFILGGSRF